MWLLLALACALPGGDSADTGGLPDVRPPDYTPAGPLYASGRVVMLSPDVAPGCGSSPACVDVWLDDAPVPAVAAFPYGGSTAFVDLPPGDLPIHLRSAGEDAYTAEIPGLVAGEAVTVVVRGLAAFGTLDHAVLEDDLTAPEDGKVRVRVHHLFYGTEARAWDVWEGAAKVVTKLAYASTQTVVVAHGSHTWLLDLDGDGAADLPIRWSTDLDADPSTADGRILDAFLLPSTTAGYPFLLVHSERTNAPGIFPPG